MSQDLSGATARLAEFVFKTARSNLPERIALKAACCMLDAIGVGLLAKDEATTKAIGSVLGTSSAADAARVWTTGQTVSVSDAVIANAVAVHG